jgi:hypothetical protein
MKNLSWGILRKTADYFQFSFSQTICRFVRIFDHHLVESLEVTERAVSCGTLIFVETYSFRHHNTHVREGTAISFKMSCSFVHVEAILKLYLPWCPKFLISIHPLNTDIYQEIN